MAYFEDLSNYVYSPEFARPRTLNVGWLDSGHDFNKAIPSEDDLDLLWEFCRFSVGQMRGIHNCNICKGDIPTVSEHRNERLLLGASEIRVFSTEGVIYAAPTLIFHYVSVHHYCPPEEFTLALRSGPRPSAEFYFERLQELGLDWNKTSLAETDGRVFRLN